MVMQSGERKMRPIRAAVVGSINMDIVVQTDRFPQSGETLLGRDIRFIPGGKGANQATALARLGAQTAMIGAAGSDDFGRSLTEALAASGVDGRAVIRLEGAPTGTASITVTPEDNSIIVVPGANGLLTPNHIRAAKSVIESSDIVLIQLEIPLETAVYAAELAHGAGKKAILNPAPAHKLPESVFRHVGCITPNRTELEELTGMNASGGGLERAMDALLEMGAPCVVTTLGADGAAWKERGGELRRQPAHRMEIVDTTGAGDAFNAGLAYALGIGRGLEEAVAFAAKVSALAVTKFGAQDGMPSRSEVQGHFGRLFES